MSVIVLSVRSEVSRDIFSFLKESLKVNVKFTKSLLLVDLIVVVLVEFVVLLATVLIGGPGRKVKQTRDTIK